PDDSTPLHLAVAAAAVHVAHLERQGKPGAARLVVEAVVARTGASDAVVDHANALFLLAAVLDRGGDPEAAATARADAEEMYAAKVSDLAPITEELGIPILDRLIEATNDRDLERASMLYAEDFELVDDNRSFGSVVDIRGRAGLVEMFASWISLVPDLVFGYRSAGRVGRYLTAVIGGSGSSSPGVPGESWTGYVFELDPAGLIRRSWQTDPTSEAMTARARELEPDSEPLASAPQITPARHTYSALLEALSAGDVEGAATLCAPGFTYDDERLADRGDAAVDAGVDAFWRSIAEAFPDAALHQEPWGEVAGVSVIRLTGRDPSTTTSAALSTQSRTQSLTHAFTVDANGRLTRAWVLDVDGADRAGALRRAADLARMGPVIGLRAYGAVMACWLDRDWDRLAQEVSPEFVMEDQRPLNWTTVQGRQGLVEFAQQWVELIPDFILTAEAIGEVEGPAGTVCVVRFNGQGAGPDGSWLEVPTIHASTCDSEGRFVQIRMLGVALDDEPAAMARATELAFAGAPTAATPDPFEMALDRLITALADRDLEAVAACYAPDYRLEDERPLGWEPVIGPQGAVEVYAGWYQLASDVRFAYELVEQVGRVAVVRWGGVGTVEDGTAEVWMLIALTLDEQGRWHRAVALPEDDIPLALRRAAELDAAPVC
ncbi:MAG: nuclear transport factor 2 family protein, partial [Nocardioides sp.]